MAELAEKRQGLSAELARLRSEYEAVARDLAGAQRLRDVLLAGQGTPLVEATELTAPDRKTAVFQFDVPASSLKPGLYTCQINVVDDVAGTFSFPRMQLFVRR